MSNLSLVGLGLIVFISTDIDDLLMLVMLFADQRLSSRQVVLGQYLGFLGLLAVSLTCSLLAVVIPPHWLGLLGIWPVVLGVHRLLHRNHGDVIGQTTEAAASSVGTLTVAMLTLANGGDNITLYTPLFATLTAGKIEILCVEFLILIGLWCGAARFLVTHPLTGAVVRRIVHAILPYVLMGLGLWILLRSFMRY